MLGRGPGGEGDGRQTLRSIQSKCDILRVLSRDMTLLLKLS